MAEDKDTASDFEGCPPLDTVIITLTPTIERDYVARGVFPTLRTGQHSAPAGTSTLHCLTPGEAELVLVDAEARIEQVRRGERHAYQAHVKNVREAIAEARTRPARLTAPEPVVNVNGDLIGTEAQFRAAGFVVQTNNNNRRAVDSRGRHGRFYRSCKIWPIFTARLAMPLPDRSLLRAEEANREARYRAETMIKNVGEAENFLRKSVRFGCAGMLNIASGAHAGGYRFDDETIDEMREGIDIIETALQSARVVFDRALHEKERARVIEPILRADPAFGTFLSGLTKGRRDAKN